MKILVIGKEGRLEHYTSDKTLLTRHSIVHVNPDTRVEEMLMAASDTQVILADAVADVPRDLICALPQLRMIHSEGVAFNRIDTIAAKERKIYVCNCKGMNADAVAEQTVLLMLGLLRDICNGDCSLREGRQIQVKEAYMLHGSLRELRDCIVGLVGFGDIARSTARLLHAFGAELVYFNRHRLDPETEARFHIRYLPLDSLLTCSDLVSMHLPVTPQTENMVNAEFLAKMKPNSYLINTARGELVDEGALLDSLRSGHLAGAALDTLRNEPVSAAHFLLQAEAEIQKKLLFSCHIGGISASSFCRGYEIFWSNLQKIEAGQIPDNVVNKWDVHS